MDEVMAFSVDDTVDLRRSILRGGDPAAQIIVDGDHVAGCFHRGVRRNGVPVATAPAFPCPSPDHDASAPWQLRFMAVEFDLQGEGLGRMVLTDVIDEVRRLGGDLLWANGRDTALDFYRAMGFTVVPGSAHLSPATNLPHHRISMDLLP